MARHHNRHRAQARQEEEEILDPASLQLASVAPEEAADLLHKGEIVAHEVIPAGTNYTFVVLMTANGSGQFLAVYKPRRGENPLWDFPGGTLHLREHAAYLTSRHLGWPNIPPTIIREGPYGIGSVQLFIPTDGQPGFMQFRRQRQRELMEIALFDLLVNNADRKGGHCLLGADDRVWAIDHGLTFNVVPKLRTILWDYCGMAIPQYLLNGLEKLRDDRACRQQLRKELQPDLDEEEIDAFFKRLEQLLRTRRFPDLDPNRNIPWPPI